MKATNLGMNRPWRGVLLLGVAALLGALGASPARADEAVQASASDRGQFLVAIKAGGMVARGFSRLTGSYLVDAELAYALPVLKHRLAIAIEGAFTAPEATGSQTDARIDGNGGTYAWKLEQREVILGASLIYRHMLGRWIPYIGVGPRVFLLQSKVSGTVGMTPVAVSGEQSTKVGAGVPLGLGLRLGPGDLFLEVSLAIAAIDHRTTGDSNTGSLGFQLGYRFML
jgi:hypothetical protein